MTAQSLHLDNTVLKTLDILTLWQNEQGIIQTGKDALAVSIKLGNETKGYIFHGKGKLILDTIIETKEGAFGKPVEKEINKPFLMLGNTKEIQENLIMASREDLHHLGYENEQGFLDEAEELYKKFFENRKTDYHKCCKGSAGVIFAFPNKADKLDILLAKDSKLIYKASDKIFLSTNRKTVLKTPEEVILSSNKKFFIVKKYVFSPKHCDFSSIKTEFQV